MVLNTPSFEDRSNLARPSAQSLTAGQQEPLNDLKQPRCAPLQITRKRKDPSGLRQSKSAPSLAHQLSHKLSQTFGNPTVVHRPNLRSRPSLPSICDDSVVISISPTQENSPQTDTDPSTYNNSGSGSPGDRSTAKTSLESNVASLRSAKAKDGAGVPIALSKDSAILEDAVQDTSLPPIQEIPIIVKPTVVTVETTANAKIFFETHFNSILFGQRSPRSQRRHELEVRLHSGTFSAEQRQRERQLWANHESEYLRQIRVLKSRTNGMIGSNGVSVAGYEVVRVLGKGSFGVVRLVREKESQHGDLGMDDSSSLRGRGRKQPSRQDSGNLRITAIEAIKSTFEAQKVTIRKEPRKFRREVYAMKVIRKSDMLRNSQEGHLRAERDFLVASENSRWVVPLVASFQDGRNLYLVMEYMVGGDFLGLLIRKNILKEKKTRWFIAEMILCIEEAHRLRWIHRDVKPDNFLISASGHLKISDFGLAFDGHWAHDQTYYNNHRYSLMEKLGIKIEGDSLDRTEGQKVAAGMKLADALLGGRERHEKPSTNGYRDDEGILHWRNQNGKRKLAKSVVGTSQYMAPEVIRGELYDGRCDWWSIGIIMFEVSIAVLICSISLG